MELNDDVYDLWHTLAAILETTQRVREACHNKKWTIQLPGEEMVMHDVMDKMARWVNNSSAILDVLVQSDPRPLAVPWTLIRVIIEVVRNPPCPNLTVVSDETTDSGSRSGRQRCGVGGA